MNTFRTGLLLAGLTGLFLAIGYLLGGQSGMLLAFLFAVPNGADGLPDNAGVGGGGVAYIFTSSLGVGLAGFVLFISAAGQFFCTTACMTSASRMTLVRRVRCGRRA